MDIKDNEVKSLLKKNLELAKENNRLLRKMRRGAIIGNILRLIWWVVLFGGPVILYYYYVQPYVGEFFAFTDGVQTGVENIQVPPFLEFFNFGGGGE